MLVYVIGKDGDPLMPTQRFGWVRRQLKAGRAKVVRSKPFTIQLLYNTTKKIEHLTGGTDPGRTNIGEAVLKDSGEAVYAAHIATRNKDIPKLMQNRAMHRRASRQGERKRRQRRAKKNGTITNPIVKDRILPGCKEPIHNKYIINSESRFANRSRPAGWLTPTANQLLQTHLNAIDEACELLPITDWCLEVNNFSFMRMEDGSIRGIDYQNGRLKGYKDAKEYIFAEQHGVCACCGKPIEHYHHIVPRHENGFDGPENLVGLCDNCHTQVHKGKLENKIKKIGEEKKYAALSILNQIFPRLYTGLVERFGIEHVHLCAGYDTKAVREQTMLPKEHYADAMCIAAIPSGTKPYLGNTVVYEIQQFRRHDRSIIHHQTERTYKLNGEVVAKNRKPRFEQKGPSLQDYLLTFPEEERRSVCSRLSVVPSKRCYNNLDRKAFPGDIFIYKHKRYVLSGQRTRGAYYLAVGVNKVNFPAKDCRLIKAGGLVYL